MAAVDREFWEEFLNMYKLFPCLWNCTSQEYANKQKRDLECQEKYPNADKNFVTTKIHSFRCAFRRELKKVIASMKSGASSDDVYVPSLWYYNILCFIADSEMPREGTSNLKRSRELEESDADSEAHFSDSQGIEESPLESPMGSAHAESSQSTSTTTASVKRLRYPERPKYGRSKEKKGKQDELMELANQTMRKFCASDDNAAYHNINNFSNLSDCNIAGLKYGRDLASLDTVQRNLLEKIVADALFFAKQGRLTLNSSFQLGTNTTFTQNNYPMQNVVQMSPWSASSSAQNERTEVGNDNMNIISDYLIFNKPQQ